MSRLTVVCCRPLPWDLGIANDILAAYEDSVKAHTVKVPTDDPVKRVRPPGRVGKSH